MSDLKKLFYRITGGRPMKYRGPSGVSDGISMRGVCYYEDRRNGTIYLAESAWSRFRVMKESPNDK